MFSNQHQHLKNNCKFNQHDRMMTANDWEYKKKEKCIHPSIWELQLYKQWTPKTQSCEGVRPLQQHFIHFVRTLSLTVPLTLSGSCAVFLVCNTNSQPPSHWHNETIKMKNKLKTKTKRKQNKRQASTQTQINPSTVLVWTCNKQWHREACDWTGWTETSILSVKLTDSTCVYWKGWGGRGCSEWHTIAFYMKSTYIQPFGDIWHGIYLFSLYKDLFFRYILATKKYDILIFQLVGYAVHIAMSQFHIFELWWVAMTLISTSSYDTAPRYVMTHE